MKRISIFLLTILCSFTMVYAQNWYQKASMVNNRRSGFCTLIGTKAYVGLGFGNSNIYYHDMWEYNTLTNAWTQKANYPGGGSNAPTSFTINGKLYVCLGFSSSYVCQNDVWMYDPLTNIWIQKNNFPGAARYGTMAFVIDNKAYLVAGSTNDGNNYLYDTYMYDPVSDSWTQKANFPGGKRAFGTAFSIAGIGYFGMGLYDSYTPTNDMYQYNPVTNLWTAIPNFPGTSRSAPVSFVINGKAYVGLGGNANSTIQYHNFGVYDPATNTWQQFSLPVNIPLRTGAIGFSCEDYAYIGLGVNANGTLNDLWSTKPVAADISGVVSYANTPATLLSNVTVKLVQGTNVIDSTITTSAGYYSFSNVPGGTYFILCSTSKPWGGVNSTDGLIITHHFVGLTLLTGINLKAGDVNNSSSVNAVDAQLCAKRFVGIINSFDAGNWAFEQPSLTISTTLNQTVNIKALCFGDVNGSFIPTN